MNILLISQCSKRALPNTRRILDQFAERRGDRVWQTPITQAGLDTLRKLLKSSARRNTAVACHWIRGRDHSELMWIVGNASLFNEQGAVPTNSTARDIRRDGDEDDWHTAEEIRIISQLAALFHDLGKANKAFQAKLKSPQGKADALRHEWISLRLFEAFVGQQSDREWLNTLAELKPTKKPAWLNRLKTDLSDQSPLPSPFSRHLPPLAQLVGWLIVSHHRLPQRSRGPIKRQLLQQLPSGIMADWCGARPDASPGDIKACWQFHTLPFASTRWCQRVNRAAKQALSRAGLLEGNWLENPYVSHLARLSLMLADHSYSSLSDPTQRVQGDPDYQVLANTLRNGSEPPVPNQPLDEHLLGVAAYSSRLVYRLPKLAQQLPRIARHRGFKERSKNDRFRWQDRAFDLARAIQEKSEVQGFFGVNMASTGCGKTLANGRIMYALADPKRGARFTIALGLRSLTLQTGQAYRERLQLASDDLAVLVGGRRIKELFARKQQEGEQSGRESTEPLLAGTDYVHYEGSLEDSPLSRWLGHNTNAEALLNAPILTCTIDHLMPATESSRGGHQIAPMLRLLSADLVLDEPDDFGLEDLPALSRLVHWAGLLGSRVLLSSATLPPALVGGLFDAYCAGRRIFQQNRGNQPFGGVCCAWFDEHKPVSSTHADPASFAAAHQQFVSQRLDNLQKQLINLPRKATLVSIDVTETDNQLYRQVADQLTPLMQELHRQHRNTDSHSDRQVSFGLIRFANIDPMIEVARLLLQQSTPAGVEIHYCLYHARHPLLVRSQLEALLDRLLNRQQPERLFDDPWLRGKLDQSTARQHLFVVLATPVAEVGRDHDYDWAIVEPSSMRSIIQLAGRVKRHRSQQPCQQANIYLLDRNLKSLQGKTPAFIHPGFEADQPGFRLHGQQLSELLTEQQLEQLHAGPRIQPRRELQPQHNLVDLEHYRLQMLMQDDQSNTLPVHRWWRTAAPFSAELQRATPFRYDPIPSHRYILRPDEDGLAIEFIEQQPGGIEVPQSEHFQLQSAIDLGLGRGISLWGSVDYLSALDTLAEQLEMEPPACAQQFGYVELPEHQEGWYYSPLGFQRRKNT